MQTSDFETLTNSELDAEIVTLAPNSADLDLALAERSRRARFMDAVLLAVRADLERAAIVDDLDLVLDFVGPATVLRHLDVETIRSPVVVATDYLDVETTVQRVRAAIASARRRPMPVSGWSVSLRLPTGALGIVCDELDRASDRPAYARLTLRGSVLSGTREDLRDFADGVESVTSDEDLDLRAETLAADSKGYPVGDALEARAKFIARALRRSRDTLLARLRRGR